MAQLIEGRDFPSYFTDDLFSVRRGGGQQGVKDAPANTGKLVFFAGNPYDPNSLLTGAEMACGLDYGNSVRTWPSYEAYIDAVSGNWTTERVEREAPRVHKNSARLHKPVVTRPNVRGTVTYTDYCDLNEVE